MFGNVSLAVQLIREAYLNGELQNLFHEQAFMQRIVVPVVKDLTTFTQQPDPLQNSGYRFVELKPDELRTGKWNFSVHSRYFKALRNIKKGMRGFALVKDTTVVGDLWCIAPSGQEIPIDHPDLRMLGITCKKGDAYAMDMLIDPAYRKYKLAAPTLLSLQLTLKQEGWHRLYAYYYEDNIPSKWMHWMLKFTELPKLRVSRFFFFIKTHKMLKQSS